MPESLTFDGVTLWTEASINVVFKSEQDIDGRVYVIEELGDTGANLYRGSKRANRAYTIKVDLVAGGGFTLDELKAWWRATHSADGGLRTLARVTASGTTCYLDCVPETPQFAESNNPTYCEVQQEYTAPTPLWYTAEVSASADFDGVTPVSLACNNVGDVPAWPRLLIENEVDTPKVSYSTEWEIEFDLDMVGGDALAVNCKTPASAWYTPSGGAAARAYGYRTAATSFRKARLAVGNHNLTLVADASTPELIANPGFETAGAGPPTFLSWVELLTHGTVTDEGADVHAGSHAALLTSTAADTDHYIHQSFVVVPGEKYTLSFWTHGDGVNDGLYGVRDLTNGAWIIDRTTQHTGVTGAAYTLVSATFTIPVACISLRIYLNGTGVNAGKVYFDDASLVNEGSCTVYWHNLYEALQ